MGERSYSKKLLDPRWQKKRLKRLDAADWCCERCRSDKDTLNVHHKKYTGEPWEAPDSDLIVVCDKCHTLEHLFADNNEVGIYLWSDKKELMINKFPPKNKIEEALHFISRTVIESYIKSGELSRYSDSFGDNSCLINIMLIVDEIDENSVYDNSVYELFMSEVRAINSMNGDDINKFDLLVYGEKNVPYHEIIGDGVYTTVVEELEHLTYAIK